MSSDIPERTRFVSLGLTVALVVSAAAGALALGAVGAASGPDDVASASQQRDSSQVQVVHAAPDAQPVDVAIDGEQVLSNVSFGNASMDIPVASGPHTVTITAAGETLFEASYTFVAGTNYTVVAASAANATDGPAIQPVILVDDPTVESANQSTVRLAHFVDDAPAVDVTVQGTDRTLFDNVSARDVSNYTTVPAGNVTLEVRQATANDSGEVLTTTNVSVEGATGYTVFALGPMDDQMGTANPSVELVIVDRPAAVSEGTTTPTPANETATQTGGNETGG